MTLILASIFCGANVALTAAILWRASFTNHRLFKDNGNNQPIRTKNKFFGAFNGLYDLLDQIPWLRRSGTANELDLLKALLIPATLTVLVGILTFQPSLVGSLFVLGFLNTEINIILLLHPVIKKLLAPSSKQ
jgi:hypothetical protein